MEQLPIIEFCFMVGVDVLFLGALLLIMLPFGIWRQAAFAVMKRNFIGYFSNPTGYVFLCLFVLLTSFAAFWPHEFFTTNLANFDQLNKFLPYIMLIFIPAITMSTWSEERRQGTDELLLTLPAHDFDIVIGKYFAAVLVFTVSLLFSQLSNYAVLISMTGGDLDSGLLFSTYLGYWFVGVAMLSLGMVASFLTNNLTVGFIFGVVFNAPLAFFSNADVIISDNQTVSRLFEWSLLQRFDPFGRGLISLPSICYFVGIAVVGIYLSLVLIGRRHWQGGKHGTSLLSHFVLRTAFLAIIVVGLVLVAQYSPANRLRLDVSRNKISTLSENTREILTSLDRQETAEGQAVAPIVIDAYVGSSIPSDFVQTKYDLVNLLREFDVMGGNRVRVNLHTNVEPFSREAILAEKRFGIRPIPYVSESRGAVRREQVILGAAFTCGLDREVIEFFPYGSQVEYELIRSINTVAQPQPARIGFVETDVFAAGGIHQVGTRRFSFPSMVIVDELRKQYEVESVSIGEPYQVFDDEEQDTSMEAMAAGDFRGQQFRNDVLVVIQPSRLAPNELNNLIDAIKAGQPTIIFEDPFPVQRSIGGSEDTPRRILPTIAPRDAGFPRGGSSESAKITELWAALGLRVSGVAREGMFIPDLIWSKYNPYKRDNSLDTPETIIVDNLEGPQISTEHPATAGIDELLFDRAGFFSIRQDVEKLGLNVTPLVVVENAGSISYAAYGQAISQGPRAAQQLERARGDVRDDTLMMAAWISSREKFQDVVAGDVNCIYVSDVDVLADEMIAFRNSPRRNGIEYRFQNISFVLNLIDSMTAQRNYIPIRNRRQRYVTLQHVEETIQKATAEVDVQLQEYEKTYANRMSAEENKSRQQLVDLQKDVEKMQEQKEAGAEIDEKAFEAKASYLEQVAKSEYGRLQRLESEMQNERNEIKRLKRLESELEIQRIQRQYKLAAVLIPPIPPLLLGLFVFTRRRLREREGISKARRLK